VNFETSAIELGLTLQLMHGGLFV